MTDPSSVISRRHFLGASVTALVPGCLGSATGGDDPAVDYDFHLRCMGGRCTVYTDVHEIGGDVEYVEMRVTHAVSSETEVYTIHEANPSRSAHTGKVGDDNLGYGDWIIVEAVTESGRYTLEHTKITEEDVE